MSISYSSWSVAKLKREKAKIEKLIVQAEAKDRKKALAELVATAKKNGFELHELVTATKTRRKKTASKAKRTRRKVAPKYRNPKKKTETWTGRGKQPHWVQAWVKQGKSLDDVRI
ncbi:MAG: H-NS histone family protein [Granulosicoccus sp.]|nr:H-NS histone family protein [Granulosicoccus sp.]